MNTFYYMQIFEITLGKKSHKRTKHKCRAVEFVTTFLQGMQNVKQALN